MTGICGYVAFIAAALTLAPIPAATRHLRQESLALAPVPVSGGALIQMPAQNGSDILYAAFILAPGRLAPGVTLVPGSDNVQPSALQCASSCEELPECNIFWYCQELEPAVCQAGALTLPAGGCQLVAQPNSAEGRMAPMLVTPGEIYRPSFMSGASISETLYAAPSVDGYILLKAQSLYGQLDYACEGSLSPPACLLQGTPEELGALCKADPLCAAISYYPEGRSDLGPSIGVFKGGTNISIAESDVTLNQHADLYLEIGQTLTTGSMLNGSHSDDSGIATGAVVGIALGSAFAGAVIALAGFTLCLRSHRRRCRRQQANGASAADVKNQTGHPLVSSALSSEDGQKKRLSQDVDSTMISFPVPSLTTTTMSSDPNSMTYMQNNSPFDEPQVDRADSTFVWDPEEWKGDVDGPASSGQSSGKARSDSSGLNTDQVIAAMRNNARGTYDVKWEDIEWVRRSDGSLHQLGAGAFSRVFLAKVGGVEELAVKVVALQGQQDEISFMREASTHFNLRHPNFVQFYGITVRGGRGFLFLEYMRAGSLFDQLHRRNEEPSAERLFGWYRRGRDVAVGVARALNYLHSQNTVHLDLKSPNVLLAPDGTPKVADVGFARVKEGLASSLLSSKIGGTWAYIAPEVLVHSQVSTAADIYAFGVLLQEICTGEIPNRGRNREPAVPEDCPQEVLDIIKRCLRFDPAERPSARNLFQLLSATQQNSR